MAPDTPPSPSDVPVVTVGEITEITAGLDAPLGLAFLPDGSVVSDRITGKVLRIDPDGADPSLVGVVLDGDVSSEGGLLGIVASPELEDDRTVFASVSGSG